jgi:hypothetical protein
MSKTRRPATRAQIEAHLKAFDNWSATDTMVNDYIRALWARERLLEAVVDAARVHHADCSRLHCAVAVGIDDLNEHDKENPR